MRMDAIKQFARLRQQLLIERANLEQRLREINEVLEKEAPPAESARPEPQARVKPKKRGRQKSALSQREAIMQALRERGPLSRKELAVAIKELGYVSKARDPLNSMGIVLYAKNAPFKKKNGKFYLPANAWTDTNNASQPQRAKRKISEEGKAKIAAAQRARWAKVKKEKAAAAE